MCPGPCSGNCELHNAVQDCIDTCGSCSDCINTVTSGFVNPIYAQWTGTSLAPLIPAARLANPGLIPCVMSLVMTLQLHACATPAMHTQAFQLRPRKHATAPVMLPKGMQATINAL